MKLSLLLAALSACLGSPGNERSLTAIALHDAGMSTAHIAGNLGITQRRVQQMVAVVGGFAARLPQHPDFADVVAFEVDRHGPNYGYKMLLGALRAHHPGWAWARRQVYDVLHQLNPAAYEARRHWAQRRIGRGVYHAPHFHYSCHIDLACKLQQYGIYFGAMLDGATRMVLCLEALTDKLPVTIYDRLFQPVADRYGVPDQLISDKGNEWRVAAFTCLFVAVMAGRHGPGYRRAHRFVQSKRNVSATTLTPSALPPLSPLSHRYNSSPFQTVVERFNYEINMRVLVPIRRLVNYMESRGLLDKNIPAHVHAFASITQPLVQYGCNLLTAAWNEHNRASVRWVGMNSTPSPLLSPQSSP
jgi:hypothetical protein